jgi:hypothetical protein
MPKGYYDLLPGQGLLFNTHKRSTSFPDFKGEIQTPDGHTYQVAGWLKSTKNVDENYLSLKITSLNQHEKAIKNLPADSDCDTEER